MIYKGGKGLLVNVSLGLYPVYHFPDDPDVQFFFRDITSIASRLVVDGKPRIIDNPLFCTVFNLSRLSIFPICHTQLALL